VKITEQIVADFKKGKTESLYRHVYPSLIVYASRMLGDDYAFLAEDCVQDAIYKMYGMKDQFRNATHFKTYLFSAIHNGAITVLRKSRRHQHYLSEKREPDEDLMASLIEQETLDLLYDAIDKLPEDLRKVFELSFTQGLKNKEIAEQLGFSVKTVNNKKARILMLLRKAVGENKTLLLLLTMMG
jgi:RNA polymerase sigma-70 factor (family 1)